MSNVKSFAHLATRLRKIRKERGLSQKDMGKALRLSDKAVSAYEVGRAVPSLETLHEISRVTHTPVAYFVDQGDDEELELQAKLATIEQELAAIKQILARRPSK